MNVYSTYWKILKKNILNIGFYMIAFLVIAVAFTQNNKSKAIQYFEETKAKVGFINQDGESAVIDGLKRFLDKHTELVRFDEYKDHAEKALFFRYAEYIFVVPEGFGKDFSSGSEARLQIKCMNDSYSSVYVERLAVRYLSMWKTAAEKEQSEEKIAAFVEKNLQKEIQTVILEKNKNTDIIYDIAYYFKYASFAVLGTLVLGITTIMGTFYEPRIYMRVSCGTIKDLYFNLKIMIGNLVFAAGVFVLNAATGFFLFGGQMLQTAVFLMLANLFVFTLTALSISIAATQLADTPLKRNAASNLISISLCFLGGVFIPQELMGEGARTLASFTPVYWFVEGNMLLTEKANVQFWDRKELWICMGIQLAFAGAMVSLALLFRKWAKYCRT